MKSLLTLYPVPALHPFIQTNAPRPQLVHYYGLVPNNSILLINHWHNRLWVFYIYRSISLNTDKKRPFVLANRIQWRKTQYSNMATFLVLWLYHIRAVLPLKLFVGFHMLCNLEATSDVNLVSILANKRVYFDALREQMLECKVIGLKTIQKFQGKCISIMLWIPDSWLYTWTMACAMAK